MLYGKRSVYQEVDAERDYQDNKWGGPAHDDTEDQQDWSRYITEYAEGKGRAASHSFRKRMVKVAALAVAAIESHDRTSPATKVVKDTTDENSETGCEGS